MKQHHLASLLHYARYRLACSEPGAWRDIFKLAANLFRTDSSQSVSEAFRKLATLSAREKKWALSRACIDQFGLDLGWLIRHIGESVDVSERVFALFENPENVRARIHSVIDLEAGDFSVKSSLVTGGVISVACFRHCVRLPDGQSIILFEKVFNPSRRTFSFRREVDVHAIVEGDAILAPRFFGACSQDGIDSVFYEFIEGEPLAFSRFHETCRELVVSLWANSEKLVWDAAGKQKAGLTQGDVVLKYFSACRKAQASGVDTPLASMGDDVLRQYDSLPLFVMHGNFSLSNILVCGERNYLIDWDKWFLARVGYGFDVAGDDDFQALCGGDVTAFDVAVVALNLPPNAVLFNVAVYNVARLSNMSGQRCLAAESFVVKFLQS
jgi:hypothetical protein